MHLFTFKKTQHKSELHKAIKGFPFANEEL